PYPLGQFFEASPTLNLMLYPEPLRFRRRHPLDPRRFQYLEGCVRKDKAYQIPTFAKHNDKPILYISFGSLGAGDTELLQRLIHLIGNLPYRALVNVGDYLEQYRDVPGNVHLASWFPQPSVIPQVDAVIHHGGNNSFTECLYFGKPALILPYVWDGHDNATRIRETRHGLKLHRYDWSDKDMAKAIETLLTDPFMAGNLARAKAHMQAQNGPEKAARLLDQLVRG
ncbi:MAG: glycosyltransferase, partial [Methylocella sp.]